MQCCRWSHQHKPLRLCQHATRGHPAASISHNDQPRGNDLYNQNSVVPTMEAWTQHRWKYGVFNVNSGRIKPAWLSQKWSVVRGVAEWLWEGNTLYTELSCARLSAMRSHQQLQPIRSWQHTWLNMWHARVKVRAQPQNIGRVKHAARAKTGEQVSMTFTHQGIVLYHSWKLMLWS